MGWNFKWVSWNTEFNFDHHVSFSAEELANKEASTTSLHKICIVQSVKESAYFTKTVQVACFTYSAYARRLDMLNVAYHYLDLLSKGEDDGGHEFPQFWLRRHDEYSK
jgi:predicted dithiol-disulfide oxidoreductase (DUF899 family)